MSLRSAGFTSRRRVVLLWGLTLVLAVAPSLSMAYSLQIGVASGVVVHSHEHDAPGHQHDHFADYHEHADGDHAHDHLGALTGDADGAGQGDQSQHPLHAHSQGCCPSVVLPSLMSVAIAQRYVPRVVLIGADALRGNPPDRLLRPPIPLFSI